MGLLPAWRKKSQLSARMWPALRSFFFGAQNALDRVESHPERLKLHQQRIVELSLRTRRPLPLFSLSRRKPDIAFLPPSPQKSNNLLGGLVYPESRRL